MLFFRESMLLLWTKNSFYMGYVVERAMLMIELINKTSN
jgi:hypothetical protein